jgi:hypothetical protein
VSERVQHDADQPCPFCAGKFALTENAGRPCVVHTLPPCTAWLVLEPLDFIAQAIQARAGTRPS